jgi:hypothetical protein
MPYEDVYIRLLWIYHNDPHWPWPDGMTITDDQLSGNQQTMDVQLVVSRDGISWERVANRSLFLPLGPHGSWDDSMLFATAPLIVGDEIWIYYSGSNMRHTYESVVKVGKTVGGTLRTESVGLAKLRLDGFLSVAAGQKEGTIHTTAFIFSGDQLWLNLDGSRRLVAAEILDDALRPISGFTSAQARPLRRNAVKQSVRWKSKSSLNSLAGRAIRLKFYMQNAELYSFWIGHQGVSAGQ